MGARHDLRDLIAAGAPDGWEIFGYPAQLNTLDDPTKPVAIVIEQRTITAARTSPDANGIPVDVELTVWVIVDATLGETREEVEDRLELAAEHMIQILEQLDAQTWDGTAGRNQYDPQKPAYDFTIRAQGALIPEETP
ncbi:hypothetical protein FVO59_12795 [Microbacterium esteraromaticum]|uniref:DUF3168 domain-containing protein n=1 Tax=Microbacterium esteraromaticum TaxID=57043 RepID=A0A7D8AD02_9MICO|nr:hypothetical protein [Microbacterium esteraromaticum]QMU97981.1 hypothetical protein FVO59_12795 [Microbacterium esteraromaticum]